MNWIRRHSATLAPVVLALTILITFWRIGSFDFINFDDPDYVTGNPFVIPGLSRSGVVWAFSNTSTGHWHPLTWLSHMLDCHLFGLNAGAHHFVNLAFHICNAFLLYLFLVKTTGSSGSSLLVAVAFGIHPLRVESVVWISERKDVLSVFFGLIALNLYSAFSRTRSISTYVVVCITFIMSLMSKPTFVTFPALLVLVDIFPLGRCSSLSPPVIWPLIREKIPLFLISVIFCAVALVGQHLGGGLQSTSAYPLPDRISSALVGYVTYLYKLFAPVGLGIFYPFRSYSTGVTIGAAILLMALSFLAIAHARSRPYLAVGWFWFLITLLPMVGFIQIGGQSVADRWTYLPHIGLIIAVVWGGREVLASAPRAQVSLSVGTCLALITITEFNLPYWRSSVPLFEHTLQVSPDNFMAHTNLGDAYLNMDEIDVAEPHLEAAVRLAPNYPEALNNLGVVYARREIFPDAAKLFNRALAQRPTFLTARYNLGLVQGRQGKNIEALAEWVTVLRQQPDYVQARESANSLRMFAEQGPCSVILRSEGAYAKTSIERLLSLTSTWRPTALDVPLQSALASLARCL